MTVIDKAHIKTPAGSGYETRALARSATDLLEQFDIRRRGAKPAQEAVRDDPSDQIERVAKALWDWEHEGRKNEILDIEWSLLRDDYLDKAKTAIAALTGSKQVQFRYKIEPIPTKGE